MIFSKKIYFFTVFFTVGFTSVCQQTDSLQSYNRLLPHSEYIRNPKAKNIILLIGDGMGLSQISSAFYFKGSIPNFHRFKDIGLIRTSGAVSKITDSKAGATAFSTGSKITDSAAGATAFSTGKKSYNGAIGVDLDTIAQPTIVDILSEKKWKTGVISTSSITHATPASFFSHVRSRTMEEAIAEDLTNSGIDFFAGGGLKYFTTREDGRNLIKEITDKDLFRFSSVSLDDIIEMDANLRYGFLLADVAMPTMLEGRGNFLSNATIKSLNYFSLGNDNFFLMVEGSQIDWGGHDNNAEYLITELIDFDNAIGVALDFAEKDRNTLVIVTADHETGGFTLSAGESYNDIKGTFSTKGHSTTLIPVFAYGPGSENFRGIYENTEIFDKMMKAARIR